MKLFVLGCSGHVKQSLVECLTGSNCKTLDESGLTVEYWNNMTNKTDLSGHESVPEVKQIEIWTWSDIKCHRGLQTFFITRGTVVLLLMSLEDETRSQDILQMWMDVKMKNPQTTILTVIICGEEEGDKCDGNIKRICDLLVNAIDELMLKIKKNVQTETTSIKPGEQDSKLFRSLELWKTEFQSSIPESTCLYFVDTSTRKGISRLKEEILRLQTNFSLANYDPLMDVLRRAVVNVREQNTVILTMTEFVSVLKKCGGTDQKRSLDYLKSHDVILYFTHDDGNEFIAVNPPLFAKLLCSIHFESEDKTFRINPARFWPHDSTCERPKPDVVVKFLEDIATLGIVRETLFPILWQEVDLPASQIHLCISVIESLGIAITYSTKYLPESITLHGFETLCPNKSYYLVLLDKLPRNKPTINWTPLPLPGDISICINHECTLRFPSGFTCRLLAKCKQSTRKVQDYSYIWSYGLLLRLDEVMLCIECKEDRVEVSGRLNPGVYSTIDECIRTMWIAMAPVLTAIKSMFEEHSTIPRKTSIVLYSDTPYAGIPNVSIPIEDFYNSKVSYVTSRRDSFNLIPFKDIPDGCTFKVWLSSLVPKSCSDLPKSYKNNAAVPNVTVKNKAKKNHMIKWKLDSVRARQMQEGQSGNRPSTKDNTNEKRSEKDTKKMKSGSHVGNKNHMINKMCDTAKSEEILTAMQQKIASSFVAVTIARGLAKYIEETERTKGLYTEKQVQLAKATADAAQASLTGSVMGITRAFQNAINVDTSETTQNGNNHKLMCSCHNSQSTDMNPRPNSSEKSLQFSKSKVCVIM